MVRCPYAMPRASCCHGQRSVNARPDFLMYLEIFEEPCFSRERRRPDSSDWLPVACASLRSRGGSNRVLHECYRPRLATEL